MKKNRIGIFAAAAVALAVVLAPVAKAALAAKNYFDAPASGSTDNVFHVNGTSNIESGGSLNVKSGGSLLVKDGSTFKLGTSGTQVKTHFFDQVTLDVPNLATTCTEDTFALTNGSTAAKGDTCVVVMGTSASEAYSQVCRISATGTAIVKSCTFGTVNPASQKIGINTLGH